MFMVLSSWQRHCESSPCSFDECRMAPSGRRPKTKPDDLGCESACTGCQSLHPPSSFIIVTQPESWYSFYRPTDGRKLSRPSWLVTRRFLHGGYFHALSYRTVTEKHSQGFWRRGWANGLSPPSKALTTTRLLSTDIQYNASDRKRLYHVHRGWTICRGFCPGCPGEGLMGLN